MIVLIASLMALNAAAIDIFIPALQDIGAALGVESENQRQFVISNYLAGFGAVQLIYGPLAECDGPQSCSLLRQRSRAGEAEKAYTAVHLTNMTGIAK